MDRAISYISKQVDLALLDTFGRGDIEAYGSGLKQSYHEGGGTTHTVVTLCELFGCAGYASQYSVPHTVETFRGKAIAV